MSLSFQRATSGVAAGAALLVGIVATSTSTAAHAQTIAASYTGSYSLVNLGSAPNTVPGNYGGLTVKSGDTSTLLLGGAANGASGALYNVGLTRDGSNHITGFSGTASQFSTAAQIDGGTVYGPGGVLFYAGFPNNTLGQIKPGSSAPDKVITLSGINSSVGTLQFIPSGFSNAGRLLIASYSSSDYYIADVVSDGSGTYDLANITQIGNPGGGPEGIIYVPGGSPLFTNPTILVSEYSANRVSAYDVNATTGLPDFATRRDFITGLNGAEGATIDPLTGDFLFSTFGSGNQVIAVRGFAAPPVIVPEAGSAALTASGMFALIGIMASRRRHRNTATAD